MKLEVGSFGMTGEKEGHLLCVRRRAFVFTLCRLYNRVSCKRPLVFVGTAIKNCSLML